MGIEFKSPSEKTVESTMNTFKLFVMLFAILAMATYAAQACAAEPKNCLPENARCRSATACCGDNVCHPHTECRHGTGGGTQCHSDLKCMPRPYYDNSGCRYQNCKKNSDCCGNDSCVLYQAGLAGEDTLDFGLCASANFFNEK